jgi:hypothetical protein
LAGVRWLSEFRGKIEADKFVNNPLFIRSGNDGR